MENQCINKSFLKLREYCESENFQGWDPYDGLNSTIFQALPIRNSRFMRLAWIQFFKRSPINFRPILAVRKGHNPKGLGLFLSGYCNLSKTNSNPEFLSKIKFLATRIVELQNRNFSGSCWGYNFDWQARAFFQPRNTPTVVATTFVAHSLIDAYEITGEREYFDIARSACDFILRDLNRHYDHLGRFCFSYSPIDDSQVYNASLLGARLLSRVYFYTKEKQLVDEARKTVDFCCSNQAANGAWDYGTLPFHHWVDSFHTGYNVECIYDYGRYSGDKSFDSNVSLGFNYYINTFFTVQGKPKYYNDSLYPIDIHAPAQLVITLCRIGQFVYHRELVDRVLIWTINNMQNDAGFFYFQMRRLVNSKIPYMRWAQAWMFLALSYYLDAVRENDEAN